MIEVTAAQMQIIQAVLEEYAPDCEARAFGSRFTHKAKPYSDLDLALVGSGELDWRRVARIGEAFQDSVLPFRVDVLDWYAISPEFRNVIETQGFEVIRPGAGTKDAAN